MPPATETVAAADLIRLPRGRHACWVVEEPEAFDRVAMAFLGQGTRAGEKTFAFGPSRGPTLHRLRARATTADPFADVLGGGTFDAGAMFEMFRREAARARDEGYAGMRLIADMDWLLPASPSAEDLAAFELMLDRELHDLGATVVCAYRSSSFGPDELERVAAAHAVVAGADPMFRLTYDDGGWVLAGEVDLSSADRLQTAIATAVADGPVTIDLGALRFMDCAGMRCLARAISSAPSPVEVRSVPEFLARSWRLVHLDDVVPLDHVA